MEPQDKVYEFLRENQINYEKKEHEMVHTMEDCENLHLPGSHCKNLFLCNRQETVFYLLLIECHKPFVTKEVSKSLGVSRLSFGKDDKLFEMLHTYPGAVSPMGLIFDSAKDIHLVIDRELLTQESIAFHPLSGTASLWMKTEDFIRRFLPLTRHEPVYIDIAGKEISNP